MGKVLSVITKPIKNFNVESRAHKLIEKGKLKAAPKHQSTLREVDHIRIQHPEAETKIHMKNPELEERLKNVYVSSYDPPANVRNIEGQRTTKILPLNRGQVDDFEYGFKEPEVVPVGKVTLRQALQLLADHENNPEVNNANHIAATYKLNQDTAGNILKYFRMYKIHIPEIRKRAELLATPVDPDKKLLDAEK